MFNVRLATHRQSSLLLCLCVVIFCVSMMALSACSNGSTGAITNSVTGMKPANTAPQYGKIGDQVKIANTWIVTIHTVKTSSGNAQSRPRHGDTYIVIDLSLANMSSRVQEVSSLLQFSLQGSTGQVYNETITGLGRPPDGMIDAGTSMDGKLIYEVPRATHGFIFTFAADTGTSEKITWPLRI